MTDDTHSLPTSEMWSAHALDLAKKRFIADSLTINEWYEKVVHFVCQNYEGHEKKYYYERYLHLLTSKKFFPTSAALVNSVSNKGALAGCMVMPLPDDISQIFGTSLEEIMRLLLLGVGIGFDLSHFSPRLLSKNNKISLGATETLLSIAHAVEKPAAYQGGKRAAFMATLFCQHPDIFEFISLKAQNSIPNINISVTFDKGFNYALTHKGLLPLLWRSDGLTHYLRTSDLAIMHASSEQRSIRGPDLSIHNDKTIFSRSVNQIVGRAIGDIIFIDSNVLLESIAHYAHACGDPGLLNLDALNRENPTHPRYSHNTNALGIGSFTTTTPCGEQPLLDYEACYLGSLNLSAFINNDQFDSTAFVASIKDALRFMDDIISLSDLSLDKANAVSLLNRKVGIGIMGFADALATLEIPYDSDGALLFTHKIGALLKSTCITTSEMLAKERGCFPNFELSKYSDENPRRHATLTTIAPTGHIATLADCSFGIEPYYLVSFEREAAGKKIYSCSVLEDKLRSLDYSLSQWIKDTEKVHSDYKFDGTLRNLIENPFVEQAKNQRLLQLKKIFKTSVEISPDAHITIIKAWQNYIDNGISKTINMSHDSSKEDVKSIIFKFINLNLKGISIFRDRCLQEQALRAPKSCEGC